MRIKYAILGRDIENVLTFLTLSGEFCLQKKRKGYFFHKTKEKAAEL